MWQNKKSILDLNSKLLAKLIAVKNDENVTKIGWYI